MFATQGYEQYTAMQTQTADRSELVIMLYQGAIKFVGRARAALERGDIEEAHTALIRGQNIIVELMGSLNMEAGETAVDLFRLYEFMHYSLVQANVHKDPKPVREVNRMLKELLPAWQQAAREVRAASAATSVGGSKGITCLAG